MPKDLRGPPATAGCSGDGGDAAGGSGDEEEDYDPFAEEPAPHIIAATAVPKAKAGNSLTPKAAGQTPKAGKALTPKVAGQTPKVPGGAVPKTAAAGGTAKALGSLVPKAAPDGPPPKATAAATCKVASLISNSKSAAGRSKSVNLVFDRQFGSEAKAPGGAPKAAALPELPPGPPPGPAPPQPLLPPGPPPEPGLAVKAAPPAQPAAWAGFTDAADAAEAVAAPLPLPPALPLPAPMLVSLPTPMLPELPVPMLPELPVPMLPPLLPLPLVGPLPLLLPGAGSDLAAGCAVGPAVAGPQPAPQGVGIAPLVEWVAHLSPQGTPYFFCKASGESRWVRPSGPQDVVVSSPGAAVGAPVAAAAPAAAAVIRPGSVAAVAAAAAAKGGPEAIKEALGEPESWESIGKTGWLRVETDKGYKYFFHKKKKATSWDCPKEVAREVAELDGVLGLVPDEAAAASGDGAAADAGDGADKSAGAEPGKAEAAAPAEAPAPVKLTKAEVKAQKEEEQRLSKEKQRFLNFKQMLIEKGVRPFDKYGVWLPKLMHDARFTAITNQTERKALFAAYAKRIDVERQKLQAEKKRGGRDGFRELLVKAEAAGLFNGRSGADTARAMERKYGEDPRWLGLKEKERERAIGELAEELAKKFKKEQDEARLGFRNLILEKLKGRTDLPQFQKMESSLRKDARWEPVDCTSTRERIYGQVVREVGESRRDRARQLKRDQDEVEQIRKKRRLNVAEEGLVNMLAERVKAPYATTWEEVVDALGDHPEMRDCTLGREEQERVFMDYRRSVTELRCQEFSQLLAGLSADVAGPDMDFEEVLEQGLDEASLKAFAGVPEQELRAAWEEWRGQALGLVLDTARQWLRSCELLAGCEAMKPNTAPFDDLLTRLNKSDVRFRRLGVFPEQQIQLVAERLAEMKEMREKGKSVIDEDMD